MTPSACYARLTDPQRKLLLRFADAFPIFVPINRVNARTRNRLEALGLIDDQWHLTQLGRAVADLVKR